MHHSRMSFRRRRAVVLASIVVESILMKLRGYPIGGMLIVRCREGHLFTTLWIPGVSVKALRLGWLRVQRCPVGGHWSVVTPVNASDLSERERRRARRTRDIPIP
jgi:hypothetical protein